MIKLPLSSEYLLRISVHSERQIQIVTLSHNTDKRGRATTGPVKMRDLRSCASKDGVKKIPLDTIDTLIPLSRSELRIDSSLKQRQLENERNSKSHARQISRINNKQRSAISSNIRLQQLKDIRIKDSISRVWGAFLQKEIPDFADKEKIEEFFANDYINYLYNKEVVEAVNKQQNFRKDQETMRIAAYKKM